MLKRTEVIEAIEKALMSDREMLTWEGSIRSWNGRRVSVLNWDYRRMAQIAYDAATETLLGYEASDTTTESLEDRESVWAGDGDGTDMK